MSFSTLATRFAELIAHQPTAKCGLRLVYKRDDYIRCGVLLCEQGQWCWYDWFQGQFHKCNSYTELGALWNITRHVRDESSIACSYISATHKPNMCTGVVGNDLCKNHTWLSFLDLKDKKETVVQAKGARLTPLALPSNRSVDWTVFFIACARAHNVDADPQANWPTVFQVMVNLSIGWEDIGRLFQAYYI